MTIQVAEAPRKESSDGRYFAARRLGHVNLYVSDVDRSFGFYKDVVGLNESYVQPLNKAAFLGNNNTHHDVAVIDIHGPLGRGRAAGLNHLAFELETEIDLVDGYGRAVSAGVAFAMTMDHDIAHSVYLPDPDGNLNEIYADVIKDWRAARSGVVTKPKPKWAPGMTPPNSDRNYHVDPPLQRVESAVFQPRRVVHASVVVKNMQASLDFYTRVVGLRPLLGPGQSAFVILVGTCGERSLSLFPAGDGRAPGYHHAGFQAWSEAELNASVARAKARGIKIEMDIAHSLRRSVFIKDPDGLLVQFFVDRDPSLSTLAALDAATALQLA
jgi:catechol 2,3-dioxygenase